MESSQAESSAEVVVIGGGVVGLAVARALALHRHKRVIVLESQSSFGLGTSGRNSEVIHAGIYYRPSSLKARLCVRGNRLLYEYLECNKIRHLKCGKLLVACSSSELGVLERLEENAMRNGVELHKVTPEQVSKIHGETNIRCVAGLWSPSSGVMDAREYMASLEKDILDHGGEIRYNSEVVGGSLSASNEESTPHTLVVNHVISKTAGTIQAHCVVNAAGLCSRRVSLALGINPADAPRLVYAKGNYFEPSSPTDFGCLSKRQLVYPIPVEGGLGIHATIDVHGGLRFGPDVEFLDVDDVHGVETIDYTVDKNREKDFQEAIGKYYIGGNNDMRLRPATAGVRPKAVDHKKKAINDFVITSTPNKRFIALYGIESPGLTASLAIAEEVVAIVERM